MEFDAELCMVSTYTVAFVIYFQILNVNLCYVTLCHHQDLRSDYREQYGCRGLDYAQDMFLFPCMYYHFIIF